MRKLVLFDIDETMVSSAGVGRRALKSALSQSLGMDIDLNGMVLSGKTDLQICREALAANGLDAADGSIDLAHILRVYLPLLEDEIRRSQDYHLHSGVRDLIFRLESMEGVFIGLLTGNIEPGARIKLDPFDLNRHFAFGAFGSDSADRLDLPQIALRRARAYSGVDFEPAHAVVIGDSVNDILCAKKSGLRSIAVNTGLTAWGALEAMAPDHLFPNLTDLEAVLQGILA